jgi:hypothetical protein
MGTGAFSDLRLRGRRSRGAYRCNGRTYVSPLDHGTSLFESYSRIAIDDRRLFRAPDVYRCVIGERWAKLRTRFFAKSPLANGFR